MAERTEDSPDVKPYTQETNTEWVNVELPPELKSIQTLLKIALDERYDVLRKKWHSSCRPTISFCIT